MGKKGKDRHREGSAHLMMVATSVGGLILLWDHHMNQLPGGAVSAAAAPILGRM